ncbi:MAG: 30S ribosomal protein S13 [Candidatus Terrybacteria bacterium]|uniref:Small ribosomal subunit protein uS13 n=2 Tax=Candidatus Terryibacteriota TaxID=1817920 RepID=A0A1G2PVL1_9BACT|nr:30S ribosomal protein S13 [Candidatus Terrybacteria bacterium]OHA48380.1 MAG: 30S ribosomal protein S13 [Candidatus Terrybacteria bacterium RIFCSPHIGHO2_01_FULL_58_15]OHA52360.1 MAG: 30S ribosomal protein S13 [Candidatus Terrybacteria bacterium RIFCSPLOWO2_01_FULL_58_14]
MPRIAGVPIPEQKPVLIALTAIYGIGKSKAAAILRDIHIEFTRRAGDLNADEVARIRERIERTELVEGELRRKTQASIKLLRDLGAYRGTRHAKRLPVRGQRTKTNSRTIRGNVRKTVTSGKRKLEKT